MSCLGQRENAGPPAIYELLEYTQAGWNVNSESQHFIRTLGGAIAHQQRRS
ncbi:hypothetical protein PsAD2_02080 [Pseudovibrio axinellae]|uniref:Uncharacterized protein n=1 Tax=Pseudovibrio axinellae TaxID=989403 RepID=A0A165YXQ0_9HYPH|nr:hypothetical protein PsAD2_02080 [Pseudovibrio axinellae]SEQ41169.1 hypothetical protein SAMN05421798_102627 [Pseudovibrio axinellae]